MCGGVPAGGGAAVVSTDLLGHLLAAHVAEAVKVAVETELEARCAAVRALSTESLYEDTPASGNYVRQDEVLAVLCRPVESEGS